MELVAPSVTKVDITNNQDIPLNIALMKKIERCGRIAYRSEDKITDDSYIRFIKGIVQRGHWSVMEHARITLDIKRSFFTKIDFEVLSDCLQPHVFLSHTSDDKSEWFTITGNFRAYLDWLSSPLPYWFIFRYVKHFLAELFPPIFGSLIKEDTPLKPKDGMMRVSEDMQYRTYHVVTDRGVMAEWTRHRYNMSFTVESTRYCNYNKRGMTFCLPIPFDFSPTEDDNEDKWIYNWLKQLGCISKESKNGDHRYFICCSNGITFDGHVSMCTTFTKMNVWRKHMEACERAYNELIERGCSPQEARSVLPQSLKSEFCVTGTKEAWDHFLKLRTASDAHPQIRYLANMIQGDQKNSK